jgi:hypothetical protein
VLKMFWGPLDQKENLALADLNHREVIVLVPLVVAVFWMGLFPRTLLDSIEPSVERVLVEYRADWNRGFSSEVTLEPRPEPPAAPADPAAEEGDGADAAGAPAADGAGAPAAAGGGGR